MTSQRPAPRLLITAGPTREPIDSVRFLSNRSSGRMGVALAAAAVGRGWPTTLLLGPVGEVVLPDVVGVVRFTTTDDLAAALAARWPHHDILIMAAAVADYRPIVPVATGASAAAVSRVPLAPSGSRSGSAPGSASRSGFGSGFGSVEGAPPVPSAAGAAPRKLARGTSRLLLELEPTPDLLEGLAATTRADQVTIGFALEAEELARRAAEKLRRKRLDAIVANPLQTMDAEDVEAALLLADGSTITPTPRRLSKPRFATWLLGEVEAIWRRRSEPH